MGCSVSSTLLTGGGGDGVIDCKKEVNKFSDVDDLSGEKDSKVDGGDNFEDKRTGFVSFVAK